MSETREDEFDMELLLLLVEAKRNDKDFMARLERIMEENAEVLQRLSGSKSGGNG